MLASSGRNKHTFLLSLSGVAKAARLVPITSSRGGRRAVRVCVTIGCRAVRLLCVEVEVLLIDRLFFRCRGRQRGAFIAEAGTVGRWAR